MAFQLIQADPEGPPRDFAKRFRSAVALRHKIKGDDVTVDVFLAATALYVKRLLACIYRVADTKPVCTNVINLSFICFKPFLLPFARF